MLVFVLIYETLVFWYGLSGKETKYRKVTARLQIRALFTSCSSSLFKFTLISPKRKYSSRKGLLSKRRHSTKNALGIRHTHHPLRTKRITSWPSFFNCKCGCMSFSKKRHLRIALKFTYLKVYLHHLVAQAEKHHWRFCWWNILPT